MTKKQKTYLPIKRLIDIAISFFAIVLLLPLFAIIALVIKIDTKGPFLFKQQRIGINNSEFYILKFRTMRTDAPKDAATDKLNNAQGWITRSGSFLRKSSLDEIPQLINIFKGEMSIVGPRPSLWNQYNLNTLRTDAKIHLIRPGLTGWAQVNGRDENDDLEKVFWDKEYLKNFGLRFDILCILKTFSAVFGSKGVLEGGVQNVKENINNR